jgi:integrase
MRVSDVMETDGIPFLNLCETEEHRLKNQNSERRVPLHHALVDLGFLEFVARRREQEPDGNLFPGLSRNRNGSMADGVCKWWARHVEKTLGPAPADGPTGARGIHSLRHSWVAAARSAGLDDSTRKRLGGWSQTDAADGYGWDGALPMLKTAIDKIEFPKVDLSALRPAGEGQ